jgi:hypothetical protein
MSMSALTKENLRRKNFSPDEFFKSDTVYRLNHDANVDNDINNYPPADIEQAILPCLMSTADLLQKVRDLLNVAVRVHSVYRCPKLNKLVGGQPDSKHMQGLAADFTAPEFGTPEEIVKFLKKKKLVVDQCLIEETWVHISKCLPNESMLRNPNRQMYGSYLFDKKLNKRIFKSV